MAENKRDFKGIWIPKEVWLDERLNALDKIILAEIDSLDSSDRGCWASNKHISDFCQCSETKVSTAISKLIEYGYLYVKSFDGRSRELKSSLSNFERQTFKKCKADFQILKESNIYNNTYNNKRKKERKITGYDEIISQIEDDSLRDLYIEYIKMRKLIKSPMTDRALTMLIKKVESLEPLSIDRQKKLLENAIMNNWKSVYPIKDNKQQDSQKPKQSAYQDQMDVLKRMYDEAEETL